MIYIAVFIILFIFSLSSKSNGGLFRISAVVLLILAGCRARSVGIDTSGGYWSYYNWILEGNNLRWVEPSWVIINKLSISLGWGYQGVIAIASLLTILPVVYVIEKKGGNKCFSLAIYYGLYLILFSFNMVRQCIAISFVLLAAYLFSENKKMRSIIVVCLAIMFHNTALFTLIALLFLRIKWNLNRVALCQILTLLMGIVINDRVFFVISGHYASNLLYKDGYTGFRDDIIKPIIFTILFNILFYYIIRFEFDNIKNNYSFCLALLGVFILNFTLRLGQGTRVVLYFSQFQLLFIPEYVSTIKGYKNKAMIVIPYFMYLSANFCRMLLAQWDSLVPYHTFFYRKYF